MKLCTTNRLLIKQSPLTNLSVSRWSRNWQTFSVKVQIVNLSGFVGHVVSVPILAVVWKSHRQCITGGAWLSPVKLHLFQQASQLALVFLPQESLLSILGIDKRGSGKVRPIIEERKSINLIK